MAVDQQDTWQNVYKQIDDMLAKARSNNAQVGARKNAGFEKEMNRERRVLDESRYYADNSQQQGSSPLGSGMQGMAQGGLDMQGMMGGGSSSAAGAGGGLYGNAATGAAQGGLYGNAATGGVASGSAAGGGSAAGAGSTLASAGPWAALAAAVIANESEARDGGYRSEDDKEYAQDLLQGKVLYQDVDQRWAPKIFGSDDSTGLGGDMRSAAAAGGLDFGKAWKHAKDDSTIAKAIDKIF